MHAEICGFTRCVLLTWWMLPPCGTSVRCPWLWASSYWVCQASRPSAHVTSLSWWSWVGRWCLFQPGTSSIALDTQPQLFWWCTCRRRRISGPTGRCIFRFRTRRKTESAPIRTGMWSRTRCHCADRCRRAGRGHGALSRTLCRTSWSRSAGRCRSWTAIPYWWCCRTLWSTPPGDRSAVTACLPRNSCLARIRCQVGSFGKPIGFLVNWSTETRFLRTGRLNEGRFWGCLLRWVGYSSISRCACLWTLGTRTNLSSTCCPPLTATLGLLVAQGSHSLSPV